LLILWRAIYRFKGRAPEDRFARLNDLYTELHASTAIFANVMQQIHNTVRAAIFRVLDIFYPLFRRIMPIQTFHYAACGGLNTLLSLSLYFISYNFVFEKQVVHFGPLAFQPHIAALLFSFVFTLPIGFYLSMYITFQGSYLRRRIQFMRYFIVILGCMAINYVLLKIFVEVIGWFPTPSQLLTTIVVILFNYFFQRNFSFKKVSPATVKN
jgi:putative flippase GtrA